MINEMFSPQRGHYQLEEYMQTYCENSDAVTAVQGKINYS